MLRAKTVTYELSQLVKLLVLSLMALFACVPSLIGDEAKSSPNQDSDPSSVFTKAAESIASNYEELPPVEVSIEQLIIDPSVKQRETITGKMENGRGTYSITQAPVFIHRSEVKLRGNQMRRDLYERIDNDWHHLETTVREGETWTIYHRTGNWAQRKLTQHLAGYPPRTQGTLEDLNRSAVYWSR